MKIKNSKRLNLRLVYLCALPFVLALLGILAYNHFKLWQYKNFYKDGTLKEVLFAKVAKEKCKFNPLVAQGGGV